MGGIAVILLFCSASIFIPFFDRIEHPFYDQREKFHLSEDSKINDLVLVAIDDESIEKIGRWPLPRELWSKLIDKLDTFGAKLIAFDVFFSEESLSCGPVRPEIMMKNSIEKFKGRVVLPYGITKGKGTKEIPDQLFDGMLEIKQKENLHLSPYLLDSKLLPLDSLLEVGPSLGFVGAVADVDGVFRRYPLVANVDGLYFPSFALAVYQASAGEISFLELLPNSYTLKVRQGNFPINELGEGRVRWQGGKGAFETVSLQDVLFSSDKAEQMRQIFKDAIVFVGSTAYAAHDLRHTPVDDTLPGVFFHMNVVAMLQAGIFPAAEDKSAQYSLIILLLGTLLILGVQYFKHAVVDLVSVIILIGGIFLLDLFYLTPEGHSIKLFMVFLSIGGCYLWNTALNFYSANKDKKFLKDAFSSYISPDLIDEMYSSGTPPRLGSTLR